MVLNFVRNSKCDLKFEGDNQKHKVFNNFHMEVP